MFTKATIGGHPIHPMLVAFPIALYTSTVAALIVFAGTHDPFWYRAAFWANLAALVMAALAALPGLVDLVSLPDHTRARSNAWKHAGLNVVALVLFLISDIVIGRAWYSAGVLVVGTPLVLGILGLLCTVGAGWLGWTMVQTHHVGVKPTVHHAAQVPPEEIDDLDELHDLAIAPPAAAPATEGERHIPIH